MQEHRNLFLLGLVVESSRVARQRGGLGLASQGSEVTTRGRAFSRGHCRGDYREHFYSEAGAMPGARWSKRINVILDIASIQSPIVKPVGCLPQL